VPRLTLVVAKIAELEMLRQQQGIGVFCLMALIMYGVQGESIEDMLKFTN